MILAQLPSFDHRGQADRTDAMLVDGIVMIHVELHLRDDTSEVGNKAAKYPRLVHPSQDKVRPLPMGQHVEEEGERKALAKSIQWKMIRLDLLKRRSLDAASLRSYAGITSRNVVP